MIGVIILLLFAFFLLKRLWLERGFLSSAGRRVLVTGCDSGFGRLLALRLLSQGCFVFAGCYSSQGKRSLEEAARELSREQQLEAIPLDITSDDSVASAFRVVREHLAEHGATLWAVVNNAGVFSIFGPDDWCTIEEYRNSLEVNTLGAIRVCHNAVPLLKQSKGRIVTMGSSAGRLHGQFVGPYCTAKFALEAYMDCLRFELRVFGVSVHILEPGAFKTTLLDEDAFNSRVDKIWNKLPDSTRMEYGERFRDNFKSAWTSGVSTIANPNLDWVIDDYCHALFSTWPRFRYYTGYDAMLLFIPLSLLPTSIQDALMGVMYSLQPGPPLQPHSLLGKSSL